MRGLGFLSELYRGVEKKRVVKRVLRSSSMGNTGIVNVHRYDPSNIGDFYCGPHHYFEQLRGKHLDIFDYKSGSRDVRDRWADLITDSALIIGGGGLLNRGAFDAQMSLFAQLGKKNKKAVLWGVGHNSKYQKDFGKPIAYNVDTSLFGLAGVRDYGSKAEWVPCVSCLHPIFDEVFTVVNEIGVVFHKSTLKNPSAMERFAHFPSTANNAVFEDVVRFIGETDTVLTDSYHAMYWSIMMGKKVMVFPNSSKFYDFKYSPVISSFERFQDDFSKLRSYSGVLEECRLINTVFAEKVFDYLNL